MALCFSKVFVSIVQSKLNNHTNGEAAYFAQEGAVGCGDRQVGRQVKSVHDDEEERQETEQGKDTLGEPQSQSRPTTNVGAHA
jgi:hypothetical protein